MRSRAIAGSGVLAAIVALYFLVSTLAWSDAALLSPGLVVFAALIVVLLLAVDQTYLMVRSVAYCNRQIDGGKRWIARRRELVGKASSLSGSRRLTVKRVVFLLVELVLSPMVMIAATIGLGDLAGRRPRRGLVDAVPPETAGLVIALVPLAVVVAGLVVARALLAAVLFPDGDGSAPRLVSYGGLPQHPPASSRRSVGTRTVLSNLATPGPSVTLLAAAAVPILIALDLRGVELGLLIGFLLLQLAITNWVLYVGTRNWWRQLKQQSELSATMENSFSRGTNPPTQRSSSTSSLHSVRVPASPNSVAFLLITERSIAPRFAGPSSPSRTASAT